jgi:hypothetical protein
LEALRQLRDDPPEHLCIEVVLCGGGETTMQGMRSFIRSHGDVLDKATSRFISFESVGRGAPRFALSQGLAVSLPLDRELAELFAAVAVAHDSGPDAYAAGPFRNGAISAGQMARAYGYRAAAITSREGDEALPLEHHTRDDVASRVDPEAIERAASFAVEAIRLLDRDLARARRPAAAEPAATSAG